MALPLTNVPAYSKDDIKLEDTDTVFKYLLCAICPITMTKPALSYAVNEQQLIGFWVKEGEEVEAPTSPEVEKDEVVDPKPVQDDKKVVIEEDDFPYLEVD